MATLDITRSGVNVPARPSRRELLGAAGFTALAGIAAVAIAKPEDIGSTDTPSAQTGENPDAELIAIGHEATELLARRRPLGEQWFASPLPSSPNYREADRRHLHAVADAMEPIDRRLDELVDSALLLSATTREGLVAKAVLSRHGMRINDGWRGEVDPDDLDPHHRLTWTLLVDLLGVSA